MSHSFKVSDLNSIFESIQRDINELVETKSRIPKDREYSSQLLDSISLEIRKLEERKAKILDMEIKMPEDILVSVQNRLNLQETKSQAKNSPEESITPKNKPVRRY